MINVLVPATSANLGPGFDCLGLALQLYNSFDVEVSDVLNLDNVEDRFNNADNLFVQAYQKGMDDMHETGSVHAVFHCDIPVSRGLGSSAAMITAGLTAASCLHENKLSKERIFELASEMEGHPDNAAPCVYGGLTASLHNENGFLTRPLPLCKDWIATVFIPDFEVSTEQARSILAKSVSLSTAAGNSAHAILMVQALATGDLSLMHESAADQLHEPYRKTLIPHFDEIKKITESDTDGVFLISGSGSTCLLLSLKPLSASALQQIQSIPGHWDVKTLKIENEGVTIREAV